MVINDFLSDSSVVLSQSTVEFAVPNLEPLTFYRFRIVINNTHYSMESVFSTSGIFNFLSSSLFSPLFPL